MPAYATLDDIRHRTSEVISSSSTPSTETVQKWLDRGTTRINAVLRKFGSPFTEEEIIEILNPICTDYAASRVFGATGKLEEAERLEKRWRDDLKELREGDIDIGKKAKATFIGAPPSAVCPPAASTTSTPATDIDDSDPVTPTPPPNARYFGWSSDKSIDLTDFANAAFSETDEGELPTQPTGAYIWFAVPESLGFPTGVVIEGSQRNQIHFYEQLPGTVNDARGEPHIIGISNQVQSAVLSEHTLTLEFTAPPPPVTLYRYFGWSDDRAIEFSDFAAATRTQANEGELPDRATGGYIWFAVPESEGYPNQILIEGSARDQSHFYERLADTIDDSEGVPHIIGISFREQSRFLARQTLTLQY